MNQLDRQARIIESLRIKSISHGQVYTFQIAIPDSQPEQISPKKREILKDSFEKQGSNLIPLIVRRTEAYSEEEEYEVIYGADWCHVAKELDIEKLWVWVFDMTDEQAATIKVEMQQLVGSPVPDPETIVDPQPESALTGIERLLDEKLQSITNKLNQLASTPSSSAQNHIDNILKGIDNKLEQLTLIVKELEERIPPKPSKLPKLNLLLAEEAQIDSRLKEAGASDKQSKAALKAIEYWRISGRNLTWDNLKKSMKVGKDKVANFAKGTYQKLQEIGDIPS